MRQTFFHELHELEKREKQEKREKVEMYLRNKKVVLRDSLPWLSITIIVFLSVVAATYAMYLFLDLTRVNDIANVHVTENLRLAIRTIQGNVFNDPEKGIHNWMLHRDSQNGFEIGHPQDWIMAESDEHLLEIRKYNSRRSVNESLAAIIYVDKLENPDKLSLVDFAAKDSVLNKDVLKMQSVEGNELVRTGKQKENSGLFYSKIYWQREGKNYRLNIVYYNQNNLGAESDLSKILDELKIL